MDTPISTSSRIVITVLWCTVFFLLTTVVFAGGTHSDHFSQPAKMVSHENYEKPTQSCETPPSKVVPKAPNVVISPQQSAPTQQNSVSPTPVVNERPQKEIPQGGSYQIYCSGPTAPGWRVDLPNGGCKPITPKIAPKKPLKPHKVVKAPVKPKIVSHATTTPNIAKGTLMPVSAPYISLKQIPNTGYNPTYLQSLIDFLFGWVW